MTTSPVCLGVCCPRHHRCERYLAVDFAPATVMRIYFCRDHESLFIDAMPAPLPVPPLVERRSS